MEDDSTFVIVGAYECADLEALPSHVSPIVAEATTEGFRRWRYRIVKPYRIALEGPLGHFRQGVDDLFPVRSYWSIAPIPFSDTLQIVAISPERVLVSESKTALVFNLLFLAASRWYRPDEMRRILITLINIFR